MKKSRWIILLAVFWLALVVRATPAKWGVWLAGPPLQMSGVSGSVWSGSAANVLVPIQGGSYSLGSLNWKLKPLSLLTLSPCAKIETRLDTQVLSGVACAGLGGKISLSDMQLTVPAAAVADLWALVKVGGEISVQLESAKFDQDAITELQGKGSWTQARYHNSESWLGLGTIAFDLLEDGSGGLNAKIFDIEGPLQLDLNTQFSMSGAYDIRGDIDLRQEAPVEIGQLLQVIANQKGQDSFSVEWNGS